MTAHHESKHRVGKKRPRGAEKTTPKVGWAARMARGAKARHPTFHATQLGLPTRQAQGLPSLRRLMANDIIAWHNRHPLAKRLNRRDITGFGVVGLPFSPRPSHPEVGDPRPRFPMFDDLSLIPGLTRHRVVSLALARGWDKRPAPKDWPVRKVPVALGWNAKESKRIYLQAAALKRGKRPALRVLVGHPGADGLVEQVLGHRVWSVPRVAAAGTLMLAGLVALAALVFMASRVPHSPATTGLSDVPVHAPEGPTSPAPTRALRADVGDTPMPMPGVPAGPADLSSPPAGLTLSQDPSLVTARPSEEKGQFGLVSPPFQDATALRDVLGDLRQAIEGMGPRVRALRIDVAGTPDGEAISVWPLTSRGEAERLARQLAARGITLTVANFDDQPPAGSGGRGGH